MKKTLTTFDMESALAVLSEWRENAEQAGRQDLLPLLHALHRDFSEQAARGELSPSTLRKTIYFLGVLMKAHPRTRQRFAQSLHYLSPKARAAEQVEIHLPIPRPRIKESVS
jgi:hypothetical protein